MVESQSPADNEYSNESAILKQPAASISKKRKIQKANNMRQYRANKMTAEEKEKQRIYMKKYRASKATAEKKAVNNMHVKRDIEHQFNLLVKRQNTMRIRGLTEQSKKNIYISKLLFQSFIK